MYLPFLLGDRIEYCNGPIETCVSLSHGLHVLVAVQGSFQGVCTQLSRSSFPPRAELKRTVYLRCHHRMSFILQDAML
jgi:hypothetical protein